MTAFGTSAHWWQTRCSELGLVQVPTSAYVLWCCAELASNLTVGYKQHDTDDPRQKWEEFAAMHVTPVRCHSYVPGYFGPCLGPVWALSRHGP